MSSAITIPNAYRLRLAVLKQDANGSVYPKLTDPEYASYKWDLTSVIPVEYQFTNYQESDVQIETVEKNTIEVLTKAKKFESGVITPPTLSFNLIAPLEAPSLAATLDQLTDVGDPFKILFLAGGFVSESYGVRTYDVVKACVATVTGEGGRQGEAKGIFTGSMNFQACHIPITGKTNCGATLEWDTSTGVVSATFTQGSGSGSEL